MTPSSSQATAPLLLQLVHIFFNSSSAPTLHSFGCLRSDNSSVRSSLFPLIVSPPLSPAAQTLGSGGERLPPKIRFEPCPLEAPAAGSDGWRAKAFFVPDGELLELNCKRALLVVDQYETKEVFQ